MIKLKSQNQYIIHLISHNRPRFLVKFGSLPNNKWLVHKEFRYNRGEKKKTLIQARRFRDSEILRLNYPTDGRSKNGHGEYPNDIGLSVVKDKNNNHTDYIGYHWQASFRGKLKTFSILLYGYKGAYQAAREWRAEQANETIKRKVAPKPINKNLIKWLKQRKIKY